MLHYRYYPTLALSLMLMVALLGLLPQQAAAHATTDVAPYTPLSIEKSVEFDATTMTGSYHITVTHEDSCKSAPGKSAGGCCYGAASKLSGGCTIDDIVVGEMTNETLIVTGTATTQGTYSEETGIWNVGDLEEGESASLWIDFTVVEQGRYFNEACILDYDYDYGYAADATAKAGTILICAYAEFIVSDRSVPDFVPEQSPGGITERGPRFAADLKASKDVAVDGTTATYTIMIENLGPQSTAKVQATDHLPDCLTFESSSANRGEYDADTWIWDIGALKVGEKVTLTIVTTITDACSGTVTNTVSVSRSSLPDPGDFFNLFDEANSAANNSASAMFDAGSGRVLNGEVFELGNNYPNPFNPTTIVPFTMTEAAHVSIKAYDLLGREVKVLVDGRMSAGAHEVVFEASTLPTGVYLIRMEAAGTVQIQRVTLMK